MKELFEWKCYGVLANETSARLARDNILRMLENDCWMDHLESIGKLIQELLASGARFKEGSFTLKQFAYKLGDEYMKMYREIVERKYD